MALHDRDVRQDVRELGDLLGDVLEAQASTAAFETVEDVRAARGIVPRVGRLGRCRRRRRRRDRGRRRRPAGTGSRGRRGTHRPAGRPRGGRRRTPRTQDEDRRGPVRRGGRRRGRLGRALGAGPHRGPDVGAEANRQVREVDKHKYCKRCPHFSEPPEVGCTHEGTDILEQLDMETFEVADCPIILEDERLEDATTAESGPTE